MEKKRGDQRLKVGRDKERARADSRDGPMATSKKKGVP